MDSFFTQFHDAPSTLLCCSIETNRPCREPSVDVLDLRDVPKYLHVRIGQT